MASEILPESVDSSRRQEAEREEASLAENTLEEQGRQNEFRRKEVILDILSNWTGYIAHISGVLVIATIAVIGWHYLGFPGLMWVDEARLNKIEGAASGIGLSVIALFLRNYLTRR